MNVVEYGRRTRKRRYLKVIIFPAFLLFIVIAIVVWKSTGNQSAEDAPEVKLDHEHFPPVKRSEIQDKLSEVDWIASDFLPINQFSRPGEMIDEVKSIVIHYIGNPGTTAEQNRNYFAGLADTGETYASSNFIIGIDGEIIQCVPVDEIAFASNVRNQDSLSIECCHPDETGEFTEETYEAVVRLTAWLCKEYELTYKDVIRHYDITGKECPKFFVDNEDEWDNFRADVADAIFVLKAQG